MRTKCYAAAAALACVVGSTASVSADASEGWHELFNGKDLSGWKANENTDTFSVVDGKIVAKGERSHLFYVGPINDGRFKNFEWKCEIRTKPNSNSGMYFHTAFEENGWPSKGYEVQINNTHGDPRKTGGLYAIADVMDESPAKDAEWFTQHVIVNGKHVVVKVNGEVTVDYKEPQNAERDGGMKGRLLSDGTIALQGHDPGSEVHFRSIKVKILP
ncbi:MAG: DUF1080 domain-containing protein [Planctomycetota bacterium]